MAQVIHMAIAIGFNAASAAFGGTVDLTAATYCKWLYHAGGRLVAGTGTDSMQHLRLV